ncbi:hypothetical protein [Paraburkholderia guartelaensis]|uniref:hypothetical protein n=1 Tax=Paraburkholderia guartelaensis TaxID=2546446 RepID=UPI002AB631A7|nr:hypothetical protein [Paraburkholderia guartelaensis]
MLFVPLRIFTAIIENVRRKPNCLTEPRSEAVARKRQHVAAGFMQQRHSDLTYKQAFVEEMRTLIPRAWAFKEGDKAHDSETVRQWRHQLHDYMNRIHRLEYNNECYDTSKRYHIYGDGPIDARQQREQFDKDLTTTLIELQHIVETFVKYGTPDRRKTFGSRAAAAPTEAPPAKPEVSAKLEVPPTITMAWIWNNTSTTFL